MGHPKGKYSTAESRWAGVGPYYAMFPAAFADRVIKAYTDKDDSIVDPFAGRGTSIFSAAIRNRYGIGIELNPVGWIYAKTKLDPAPEDQVLDRVRKIGSIANRRTSNPRLPVFFNWCFSLHVRQFLVTARKHLDWRRCKVDRTLMALLLVNMHGKRDASLSNQMRQTKAMSPTYAVNWWKKRKLKPPEIDPVPFMEKKVAWRYAKGTPETAASFVYLGDSTTRLTYAKDRMSALDVPRASLLFTSPPYCGITNYHYDQWLRLWLLGGPPNALAIAGANRGKFVDRENYQRLLFEVFSQAKPLLKKNAVVYVRTDHREITRKITVDILKEVFPKKRLVTRKRDVEQSQTQLFNKQHETSAEIDLILHPAA